MRKIYTIVLIICALYNLNWAQTGIMPTGDAGNLLSGEHTPVIWSGAGVINGAGNNYTTTWQQIGSSPFSSAVLNNNIAVYDPEKFTLTLKLSCYGAGDSARISQAIFSMAFDTTAAAAWTADSTNVFIKSGNYNHPLYGQGLYEVLADTARRWDYPLRVVRGGFIRFIFSTTTSDSVNVSWTLWGEH